jgi:hypothetical protein
VQEPERPHTPPSFVKFLSKACLVKIGSFNSIPSKLHVPELMYADFADFIGQPATAEAVSWLATKWTGTFFKDSILLLKLGITVPSSLHGITGAVNIGMFNFNFSRTIVRIP